MAIEIQCEEGLYERGLRVLIYIIMIVFTIVCIFVIIIISFLYGTNKKAPVQRRVLVEVGNKEGIPEGTPDIDRALRNPGCSQPMYFRCLNNSEYGMGDWVFVRHSQDSWPHNLGSCRRWRPDALCLGKSRAHFRKQATCVTSCEERKEKRCLDLVTEALLRNCSESRQSANQRRYWYYDRITRSCLKWSSKTCAYNAFRSSGHCRDTCLRSKTKSEQPQD